MDEEKNAAPQLGQQKKITEEKRSSAEIIYDLRMQLRSLSIVLSETSILLVELWDAEDLL